MIINLPAIYKGRTRTLPTISPTLAQKADLAKINRIVVDYWAAQIPALMAAYNPTPLQIDNAQEAGQVLDEAERVSQILVLGINPRLRNYAVRIVEWHKAKFAQFALTATDVAIDTTLAGALSGDTVETFLARNLALIKDISATTQGKMSDVIFRGLQGRTPARKVAKELQSVVEISKKRAVRIASDQLQKLTSQLDTERMLDVGIKKWKWRHSGKLHPRPEHVARDNKIYLFSKPPDDMPGELPYCGCAKSAVIG